MNFVRSTNNRDGRELLLESLLATNGQHAWYSWLAADYWDQLNHESASLIPQLQSKFGRGDADDLDGRIFGIRRYHWVHNCLVIKRIAGGPWSRVLFGGDLALMLGTYQDLQLRAIRQIFALVAAEDVANLVADLKDQGWREKQVNRYSLTLECALQAANENVVNRSPSLRLAIAWRFSPAGARLSQDDLIRLRRPIAKLKSIGCNGSLIRPEALLLYSSSSFAALPCGLPFYHLVDVRAVLDQHRLDWDFVEELALTSHSRDHLNQARQELKTRGYEFPYQLKVGLGEFCDPWLRMGNKFIPKQIRFGYRSAARVALSKESEN